MNEQYILILSNKNDVTTDLVENKLRDFNVNYLRFNTECFTKNITSSLKLTNKEKKATIYFPKFSIEDVQIKSVWYRRPKLPKLVSILNNDEKEFANREINSFFLNLYSYLADSRWVNNPFKLYLAERKIYQLKIAVDCGFDIPDTSLTNDYDSFRKFIKINNNKIIAKPLSNGSYGKGDTYAIFTSDLEKQKYISSKKIIKQSPFILQEKIQKKYDIRVTVFGNILFAHKILTSSNDLIDWRAAEFSEVEYSRIDIPKKIKNGIINYMKRMELLYGAIDFIVDKDGKWVFIEINPSGQFAWLQIATGDKMIEELIKLLWEK